MKYLCGLTVALIIRGVFEFVHLDEWLSGWICCVLYVAVTEWYEETYTKKQSDLK